MNRGVTAEVVGRDGKDGTGQVIRKVRYCRLCTNKQASGTVMASQRVSGKGKRKTQNVIT